MHFRPNTRGREAAPWADYGSGIMPAPARDQVRDRWRATDMIPRA